MVWFQQIKRLTMLLLFDGFIILILLTVSLLTQKTKTVSNYDQEIPQSQTADKPMALYRQVVGIPLDTNCAPSSFVIRGTL